MIRNNGFVTNIMSVMKNPSLLVKECERLLSKFVFEYKYGTGVDVMHKDWDNLIILDACRYDFFAELNQMDGELSRVISKGSHSKEFIKNNFTEGEYHDTIVITANPFIEEIDNDVFFRVYYSEIFEHWNEDLRTIPPEAIVEKTLEIHEQYPNKRLIIHFMQPHAPYIGPTGRDLAEQQEFGVLNPDLDNYSSTDIGIAQAVTEGIIDEDDLKQAYKENVEVALEHSETLINQLDGKTVITADHGEMLGERILIQKTYAHPQDVYTPELRMVPWFVVDTDNRRKISTGEPIGFDGLDESIRESRLEALGYV